MEKVTEKGHFILDQNKNGTYRVSTRDKIYSVLAVGGLFALIGFIIFEMLNEGNNESYRPLQHFLITLLATVVGLAIGAFAMVIATAAENKERNYLAFFAMSLFISPFLAAVIVATLPPKTASSPQSGDTPKDTVSEIKKLKGLMNDGILTQAEFEKKKKELLERM